MNREGSIRVAIAGCGQWGMNHVRTFSHLPETEVVGVADSDTSRLKMVSDVFPEIGLFENVETMLDAVEADALVVATPADSHKAVSEAALKRGLHVLCEKPMCLASSDARQLQMAADKAGVILMTGHVFLFNAGIVKLKELLTSGELGDPYYFAAVRTNLGMIRADVNVSYDLATHDISIFNWLLDSVPTSVSATGASFIQPGIEEVAFITMRYANGAIAHIHTSWLSPKKVRQITVVGNKRMAFWDDLELAGPVTLFDKGAEADKTYEDFGQFLRLSYRDGDIRIPKVNVEEPLKTQARAFVSYIRAGKAERADAEHAVGVIATLEAIEVSLAAEGQPVAVSVDPS